MTEYQEALQRAKEIYVIAKTRSDDLKMRSDKAYENKDWEEHIALLRLFNQENAIVYVLKQVFGHDALVQN